MMSTVQLFCGLTGAVNTISCLSLAVFLYLKNPAGKINKIFAFWSLSVAFWSWGYFMWLFTPGYSGALFWARFLMAGAIVIPSTFLHFTVVYLGINKKFVLLIRACYLFSASYLLLDMTPLCIEKVVPRYWFRWWPIPGPLYHIFQIYFVATVVIAHILLFRRAYLERNVVRKNQFRIVAIGTLIAYAGGSTNYFLWYNIPVPPIFNFLVTFYVAFIAYAILHYRLWDLDFIIRKTIVFTGLFTAVAVAGAGVMALTQGVIGRYFRIPMPVTTVLSVAIAIFLYEPIKNLLINLTDRFLFQKKFKITEIVTQASEAIALVQSLKWLSRRIVAFLVTKCRITSAAVYLRTRDNKSFFMRARRGERARVEHLSRIIWSDDAVIKYLEERGRPVERAQLEDLQGNGKNAAVVAKVLEFLKENKVEVIVPSFLRRRISEAGMGKEMEPGEREASLRNVLLLGPKKSDEAYTQEELDVFYSLAQESAIAIENARLYDEAVERSRLLAEINSELEHAHDKLKVAQASLIVAEKKATMVGMAKAIGHEVNNPLSTVIYRSEDIYKDKMIKLKNLLAENAGLLPGDIKTKLDKLLFQIEDDASRAGRSAQRINAVIRTLTDILRDTKGELSALSLYVLCRQSIEAARFSTYEENLGGCTIDLDFGSNLLILGNQDQLMQVFLNLIKNAYEAMGNQRERKIVIRANVDTEDRRMVRIEFIDNGPGIPPEVLPKIWEQGFSTKQKADNSIGAAGQGQGLYIVKHMIESIHKGSIVAESKPGAGTTFILKLPMPEIIQEAAANA